MHESVMIQYLSNNNFQKRILDSKDAPPVSSTTLDKTKGVISLPIMFRSLKQKMNAN